MVTMQHLSVSAALTCLGQMRQRLSARVSLAKWAAYGEPNSRYKRQRVKSLENLLAQLLAHVLLRLSTWRP